eukprot:1378771-Prymnesium_polylepis.1
MHKPRPSHKRGNRCNGGCARDADTFQDCVIRSEAACAAGVALSIACCWVALAVGSVLEWCDAHQIASRVREAGHLTDRVAVVDKDDTPFGHAHSTRLLPEFLKLATHHDRLIKVVWPACGERCLDACVRRIENTKALREHVVGVKLDRQEIFSNCGNLRRAARDLCSCATHHLPHGALTTHEVAGVAEPSKSKPCPKIVTLLAQPVAVPRGSTVSLKLIDATRMFEKSM